MNKQTKEKLLNTLSLIQEASPEVADLAQEAKDILTKEKEKKEPSKIIQMVKYDGGALIVLDDDGEVWFSNSQKPFIRWFTQ
jgi:hypothetical protein